MLCPLMIVTFHFAAMTNQQLVDNGNRMMDETDQAIERSKKVSSNSYVQRIKFTAGFKLLLCPAYFVRRN